MTVSFEPCTLLTFLGKQPSHFSPSWSLTATTGGYPAVGFSAAAFTDAAAPAAAPPVFAAPRPPNNPARAACPSPSASGSRYALTTLKARWLWELQAGAGGRRGWSLPAYYPGNYPLKTCI
jgi:hypothetical protein